VRGVSPDGDIAFDYVPFSALFARADVLVPHGGIGTTGLAMHSGRPMLIVPRAHDQPDNAARAARLGISRTIPAQRYTADRAAAELDRSSDVGADGKAGRFVRRRRRALPFVDICDCYTLGRRAPGCPTRTGRRVLGERCVQRRTTAWRTGPGFGNIHSSRPRAARPLSAVRPNDPGQPWAGAGMPRSRITVESETPRTLASSANACTRSASMRSTSSVSRSSSSCSSVVRSSSWRRPISSL
jgi:hypothetical protein